jgi:formate hydrogenlyase subunit 3/multisubunit Na+/H+ antiporter MnhD subunit
MTTFAFALAGLSLMGVPPSGGFTAKLLLLTAAIETGQWWWAMAVLGGGLLTGGYLYRVLAPAVAGADAPLATCAPVPPYREAVVLALALASMVLGLVPLGSFGLLQVGRFAMGISP